MNYTHVNITMEFYFLVSRQSKTTFLGVFARAWIHCQFITLSLSQSDTVTK